MSDSLLLADAGPGEELPGFDLDDPVLPKEIADQALTSGGFRAVLSRINYTGKDVAVVGMPDPKIVGSGPKFFATA
jgi:hypothetical protein